MRGGFRHFFLEKLEYLNALLYNVHICIYTTVHTKYVQRYVQLVPKSKAPWGSRYTNRVKIWKLDQPTYLLTGVGAQDAIVSKNSLLLDIQVWFFIMLSVWVPLIVWTTKCIRGTGSLEALSRVSTYFGSKSWIFTIWFLLMCFFIMLLIWVSCLLTMNLWDNWSVPTLFGKWWFCGILQITLGAVMQAQNMQNFQNLKSIPPQH